MTGNNKLIDCGFRIASDGAGGFRLEYKPLTGPWTPIAAVTTEGILTQANKLDEDYYGTGPGQTFYNETTNELETIESWQNAQIQK